MRGMKHTMEATPYSNITETSNKPAGDGVMRRRHAISQKKPSPENQHEHDGDPFFLHDIDRNVRYETHNRGDTAPEDL